MRISEKIAIAAHLHVLLRRKTGRVTDTEWMALNQDYATEIIRFARTKAIEDGHPELTEWADKLEKATVDDPGRAPVLAPHPPAAQARVVPDAVQEHEGGFFQSVFGESGFADSGTGGRGARVARDPKAPRYVGGIR